MKTTLWLCAASAVLGGLVSVMISNGTLGWNSAKAATEQRGPANQERTPSNVQFSQPQAFQFGDYTPEELVNIAVYDKVNRSVVNIRTTGEVRGQLPFQAIPVEGSGSGWVLDQKGHIVTNYHVVEGSNSVEVTLHDGQALPADIVGTDPANDVAVLQANFPPESLIPVELGDSAALRVGQKIFAIGNPFGLERTMAEGIVSSLNRTLRSESRERRLIKSIIQIDAALNKGNSGGPLLDTHGRLVGMNTAIITSTGDSSGIGFAIPVNSIKRVLPQLIENGRVIRPTLGIEKTFEMTNGLLGIYALVEDGPAEKAGLQAAMTIERRRFGSAVIVSQRVDPSRADLIYAVDGHQVKSFDDLLNEIEKHRPGDRVTVTVFRDGKKVDVAVVLDEEQN